MQLVSSPISSKGKVPEEKLLLKKNPDTIRIKVRQSKTEEIKIVERQNHNRSTQNTRNGKHRLRYNHAVTSQMT